MANTTDRRKFISPAPVIPGRPVDWQLGGENPEIRYLYQLIGDVAANKAEIGTVSLPTTGALTNDLLVFDGTAWTNVNKAALLALDDLTDVTITGLAVNHILKYDGTKWVNGTFSEVLSLDNLSDVAISAAADGDLLVYNAGLTRWGNRNWTPATFGAGAAPTQGQIQATFSDAGTSFGGLALTNTDATSKRTTIRHNNLWDLGNDLGATGAQSFSLKDRSAAAIRWHVDASGRFQIGGSSPTAFLHLPAGAAGASNAPLKFVSGTNLTTPEAGVMEYNGSSFFLTPASSRYTVLLSTLNDPQDIVLGTTTGTKIGTATSQKLGFWNKTPVVQPAAYTVTNHTDSRSLDETGATLAQLANVVGTLIRDIQSWGGVG